MTDQSAQLEVGLFPSGSPRDLPGEKIGLFSVFHLARRGALTHRDHRRGGH
jgi:hypothetical protein